MQEMDDDEEERQRWAALQRRASLQARTPEEAYRLTRSVSRGLLELPTPPPATLGAGAKRLSDSASLFGRHVTAEEAKMRSQWLLQRTGKRQSQIGCTEGRIVHEVPFKEDLHGLYTLCYSPNGDVFACGFGNGSIQVRSGTTAAVLHTLRSGAGLSSVPVMCCRFDRRRSNIFYSATACGSIFLCHAVSGEFTRFATEEKNETNAIDLDAEGSILVSGGRDGKVRVYDIPTQKLLHRYAPSATMTAVEPQLRGVHSQRVFAVRAHPLVQFIFLTGGWDKAVKVWDIRQKNLAVNTFFGPHICGDALDVKNDQVLTGSWTNEDSLQLWDMRTFQKIEDVNPKNRVPTMKGEFLYVAKYYDGDPYGDMVLVAGSGLSHVEVVGIQQKRVLCCWKSGHPVHTADSFRHYVAYSGAESSIKVCDFT